MNKFGKLEKVKRNYVKFLNLFVTSQKLFNRYAHNSLSTQGDHKNLRNATCINIINSKKTKIWCIHMYILMHQHL